MTEPGFGETPAEPRHPWQRLPAESAPAFEAFSLYRDQLADRSTGHVAKGLGKSKRQIDEWSSKHHWVDRVRAYDEHIGSVKLKASEDAIVLMSRRQAEAAQLQQYTLTLFPMELVRRLVENPLLIRDIPLDALIDLQPRLPRPLFVAAEMERRARGLESASKPTSGEDPVLAAALNDEGMRDALAIVTRKAVAELEKQEPR